MAQQIQELIDKIKSEGIQAASEKAQEIAVQAKLKAQEILDQAQKEAAQLILKTKDDCKKFEESTRIALKQSSRDTLLELRKEILQTLHAVISANIKTSLTPQALGSMIETTIKNFLQQKSSSIDIRIFLSPSDLENLKNGFIAKLQEELRKPITLQAREDVNAGFTISFDAGKSSFDFTDSSLAEYLSGYLNPEVASLLKEGHK